MGWDGLPSNGARYSIAIISDEQSTFPEIGRFLAQTFRTILATNEEQIEALVSAPQLTASCSIWTASVTVPTMGLKS